MDFKTPSRKSIENDQLYSSENRSNYSSIASSPFFKNYKTSVDYVKQVMQMVSILNSVFDQHKHSNLQDFFILLREQKINLDKHKVALQKLKNVIKCVIRRKELQTFQDIKEYSQVTQKYNIKQQLLSIPIAKKKAQPVKKSPFEKNRGSELGKIKLIFNEMKSEGVTFSNISLQNIKSYFEFERAIRIISKLIYRKQFNWKEVVFRVVFMKIYIQGLSKKKIMKKFKKQNIEKMKLIIKKIQEKGVKSLLVIVDDEEVLDQISGNPRRSGLSSSTSLDSESIIDPSPRRQVNQYLKRRQLLKKILNKNSLPSSVNNRELDRYVNYERALVSLFRVIDRAIHRMVSFSMQELHRKVGYKMAKQATLKNLLNQYIHRVSQPIQRAFYAWLSQTTRIKKESEFFFKINKVMRKKNVRNLRECFWILKINNINKMYTQSKIKDKTIFIKAFINQMKKIQEARLRPSFHQLQRYLQFQKRNHEKIIFILGSIYKKKISQAFSKIVTFHLNLNSKNSVAQSTLLAILTRKLYIKQLQTAFGKIKNNLMINSFSPQSFLLSQLIQILQKNLAQLMAISFNSIKQYSNNQQFQKLNNQANYKHLSFFILNFLKKKIFQIYKDFLSKLQRQQKAKKRQIPSIKQLIKSLENIIQHQKKQALQEILSYYRSQLRVVSNRTAKITQINLLVDVIKKHLIINKTTAFSKIKAYISNTKKLKYDAIRIINITSLNNIRRKKIEGLAAILLKSQYILNRNNKIQQLITVVQKTYALKQYAQKEKSFNQIKNFCKFIIKRANYLAKITQQKLNKTKQESFKKLKSYRDYIKNTEQIKQAKLSQGLVILQGYFQSKINMSLAYSFNEISIYTYQQIFQRQQKIYKMVQICEKLKYCSIFMAFQKLKFPDEYVSVGGLKKSSSQHSLIHEIVKKVNEENQKFYASEIVNQLKQDGEKLNKIEKLQDQMDDLQKKQINHFQIYDQLQTVLKDAFINQSSKYNSPRLTDHNSSQKCNQDNFAPTNNTFFSPSEKKDIVEESQDQGDYKYPSLASPEFYENEANKRSKQTLRNLQDQQNSNENQQSSDSCDNSKAIKKNQENNSFKENQSISFGQDHEQNRVLRSKKQSNNAENLQESDDNAQSDNCESEYENEFLNLQDPTEILLQVNKELDNQNNLFNQNQNLPQYQEENKKASPSRSTDQDNYYSNYENPDNNYIDYIKSDSDIPHEKNTFELQSNQQKPESTNPINRKLFGQNQQGNIIPQSEQINNSSPNTNQQFKYQSEIPKIIIKSEDDVSEILEYPQKKISQQNQNIGDEQKQAQLAIQQQISQPEQSVQYSNDLINEQQQNQQEDIVHQKVNRDEQNGIPHIQNQSLNEERCNQNVNPQASNDHTSNFNSSQNQRVSQIKVQSQTPLSLIGINDNSMQLPSSNLNIQQQQSRDYSPPGKPQMNYLTPSQIKQLMNTSNNPIIANQFYQQQKPKVEEQQKQLHQRPQPPTPVSLVGYSMLEQSIDLEKSQEIQNRNQLYPVRQQLPVMTPQQIKQIFERQNKNSNESPRSQNLLQVEKGSITVFEAPQDQQHGDYFHNSSLQNEQNADQQSQNNRQDAHFTPSQIKGWLNQSQNLSFSQNASPQNSQHNQQNQQNDPNQIKQDQLNNSFENKNKSRVNQIRMQPLTPVSLRGQFSQIDKSMFDTTNNNYDSQQQENSQKEPIGKPQLPFLTPQQIMQIMRGGNNTTDVQKNPDDSQQNLLVQTSKNRNMSNSPKSSTSLAYRIKQQQNTNQYPISDQVDQDDNLPQFSPNTSFDMFSNKMFGDGSIQKQQLLDNLNSNNPIFKFDSSQQMTPTSQSIKFQPQRLNNFRLQELDVSDLSNAFSQQETPLQQDTSNNITQLSILNNLNQQDDQNLQRKDSTNQINMQRQSSSLSPYQRNLVQQKYQPSIFKSQSILTPNNQKNSSYVSTSLQNIDRAKQNESEQPNSLYPSISELQPAQSLESSIENQEQSGKSTQDQQINPQNQQILDNLKNQIPSPQQNQNRNNIENDSYPSQTNEPYNKQDRQVDQQQSQQLLEQQEILQSYQQALYPNKRQENYLKQSNQQEENNIDQLQNAPSNYISQNNVISYQNNTQPKSIQFNQQNMPSTQNTYESQQNFLSDQQQAQRENNQEKQQIMNDQKQSFQNPQFDQKQNQSNQKSINNQNQVNNEEQNPNKINQQQNFTNKNNSNNQQYYVMQVSQKEFDVPATQQSVIMPQGNNQNQGQIDQQSNPLSQTISPQHQKNQSQQQQALDNNIQFLNQSQSPLNKQNFNVQNQINNSSGQNSPLQNIQQQEFQQPLNNRNQYFQPNSNLISSNQVPNQSNEEVQQFIQDNIDDFDTDSVKRQKQQNQKQNQVGDQILNTPVKNNNQNITNQRKNKLVQDVQNLNKQQSNQINQKPLIQPKDTQQQDQAYPYVQNKDDKDQKDYSYLNRFPLEDSQYQYGDSLLQNSPQNKFQNQDMSQSKKLQTFQASSDQNQQNEEIYQNNMIDQQNQNQFDIKSQNNYLQQINQQESIPNMNNNFETDQNYLIKVQMQIFQGQNSGYEQNQNIIPNEEQKREEQSNKMSLPIQKNYSNQMFNIDNQIPNNLYNTYQDNKQSHPNKEKLQTFQFQDSDTQYNSQLSPYNIHEEQFDNNPLQYSNQNNNQGFPNIDDQQNKNNSKQIIQQNQPSQQFEYQNSQDRSDNMYNQNYQEEQQIQFIPKQVNQMQGDLLLNIVNLSNQQTNNQLRKNLSLQNFQNQNINEIPQQVQYFQDNQTNDGNDKNVNYQDYTQNLNSQYDSQQIEENQYEKTQTSLKAPQLQSYLPKIDLSQSPIQNQQNKVFRQKTLTQEVTPKIENNGMISFLPDNQLRPSQSLKNEKNTNNSFLESPQVQKQNVQNYPNISYTPSQKQFDNNVQNQRNLQPQNSNHKVQNSEQDNIYLPQKGQTQRTQDNFPIQNIQQQVSSPFNSNREQIGSHQNQSQINQDQQNKDANQFYQEQQFSNQLNNYQNQKTQQNSNQPNQQYIDQGLIQNNYFQDSDSVKRLKQQKENQIKEEQEKQINPENRNQSKNNSSNINKFRQEPDQFQRNDYQNNFNSYPIQVYYQNNDLQDQQQTDKTNYNQQNQQQQRQSGQDQYANTRQISNQNQQQLQNQQYPSVQNIQNANEQQNLYSQQQLQNNQIPQRIIQEDQSLKYPNRQNSNQDNQIKEIYNSQYSNIENKQTIKNQGDSNQLYSQFQLPQQQQDSLQKNSQMQQQNNPNVGESQQFDQNFDLQNKRQMYGLKNFQQPSNQLNNDSNTNLQNRQNEQIISYRGKQNQNRTQKEQPNDQMIDRVNQFEDQINQRYSQNTPQSSQYQQLARNIDKQDLEQPEKQLFSNGQNQFRQMGQKQVQYYPESDNSNNYNNENNGRSPVNQIQQDPSYQKYEENLENIYNNQKINQIPNIAAANVSPILDLNLSPIQNLQNKIQTQKSTTIEITPNMETNRTTSFLPENQEATYYNISQLQSPQTNKQNQSRNFISQNTPNQITQQKFNHPQIESNMWNQQNCQRQDQSSEFKQQFQAPQQESNNLAEVNNTNQNYQEQPNQQMENQQNYKRFLQNQMQQQFQGQRYDNNNFKPEQQSQQNDPVQNNIIANQQIIDQNYNLDNDDIKKQKSKLQNVNMPQNVSQYEKILASQHPDSNSNIPNQFYKDYQPDNQQQIQSNRLQSQNEQQVQVQQQNYSQKQQLNPLIQNQNNLQYDNKRDGFNQQYQQPQLNYYENQEQNIEIYNKNETSPYQQSKIGKNLNQSYQQPKFQNEINQQPVDQINDYSDSQRYNLIHDQQHNDFRNPNQIFPNQRTQMTQNFPQAINRIQKNQKQNPYQQSQQPRIISNEEYQMQPQQQMIQYAIKQQMIPQKDQNNKESKLNSSLNNTQQNQMDEHPQGYDQNSRVNEENLSSQRINSSNKHYFVDQQLPNEQDLYFQNNQQSNCFSNQSQKLVQDQDQNQNRQIKLMQQQQNNYSGLTIPSKLNNPDLNRIQDRQQSLTNQSSPFNKQNQLQNVAFQKQQNPQGLNQELMSNEPNIQNRQIQQNTYWDKQQPFVEQPQIQQQNQYPNQYLENNNQGLNKNQNQLDVQKQNYQFPETKQTYFQEQAINKIQQRPQAQIQNQDNLNNNQINNQNKQNFDKEQQQGNQEQEYPQRNEQIYSIPHQIQEKYSIQNQKPQNLQSQNNNKGIPSTPQSSNRLNRQNQFNNVYQPSTPNEFENISYGQYQNPNKLKEQKNLSQDQSLDQSQNNQNSIYQLQNQSNQPNQQTKPQIQNNQPQFEQGDQPQINQKRNSQNVHQQFDNNPNQQNQFLNKQQQLNQPPQMLYPNKQDMSAEDNDSRQQQNLYNQPRQDINKAQHKSQFQQYQPQEYSKQEKNQSEKLQNRRSNPDYLEYKNQNDLQQVTKNLSRNNSQQSQNNQFQQLDDLNQDQNSQFSNYPQKFQDQIQQLVQNPQQQVPYKQKSLDAYWQNLNNQPVQNQMIDQTIQQVRPKINSQQGQFINESIQNPKNNSDLFSQQIINQPQKGLKDLSKNSNQQQRQQQNHQPQFVNQQPNNQQSNYPQKLSNQIQQLAQQPEVQNLSNQNLKREMVSNNSDQGYNNLNKSVNQQSTIIQYPQLNQSNDQILDFQGVNLGQHQIQNKILEQKPNQNQISQQKFRQELPNNNQLQGQFSRNPSQEMIKNANLNNSKQNINPQQSSNHPQNKYQQTYYPEQVLDEDCPANYQRQLQNFNQEIPTQQQQFNQNEGNKLNLINKQKRPSIQQQNSQINQNLPNRFDNNQYSQYPDNLQYQDQFTDYDQQFQQQQQQNKQFYPNDPYNNKSNLNKIQQNFIDPKKNISDKNYDNYNEREQHNIEGKQQPQSQQQKYSNINAAKSQQPFKQQIPSGQEEFIYPQNDQLDHYDNKQQIKHFLSSLDETSQNSPNRNKQIDRDIINQGQQQNPIQNRSMNNQVTQILPPKNDYQNQQNNLQFTPQQKYLNQNLGINDLPNNQQQSFDNQEYSKTQQQPQQDIGSNLNKIQRLSNSSQLQNRTQQKIQALSPQTYYLQDSPQNQFQDQIQDMMNQYPYQDIISGKDNRQVYNSNNQQKQSKSIINSQINAQLKDQGQLTRNSQISNPDNQNPSKIQNTHSQQNLSKAPQTSNDNFFNQQQQNPTRVPLSQREKLDPQTLEDLSDIQQFLESRRRDRPKPKSKLNVQILEDDPFSQ